MVAAIESYGLLGDTRTAALVDCNGSLDWMCVPRFDGPPVFGRLVGGAAAGSFGLGPRHAAYLVTRRYRGDSATLETTWQTESGRMILTEGMVAELGGRLLPTTMLVRRLSAPDGPVEAVLDFDPRLGDRHRPPRTEHRHGALVCSWSTLALALLNSHGLTIQPGQRRSVSVTPDRPLTCVMSVAHREPLVYVDPETAWKFLRRDEERWQGWCDGIDGGLPHRPAVVRSLLTLRLLTYSPSGAPVAAPTTSLPEVLGGVRNWDYRYAWPRDASIGIDAFLGVGKQEEARAFMAWLLSATRIDRPRLPVLLNLHGKHPGSERELAGWPGYAGSAPVRSGNAAADQHQLDGCGWVLDAASRLSEAGHRLYSETWRTMAGFADQVAHRWREPDDGIWEIRSDSVHHVHSKLMAWLALDRALRLSAHHRTSGRRIRRWATERAALRHEIEHRGFDEELGAYTRSYGSPDTDAALLVLSQLDFHPSGSPRIDGTIAAVTRELDAGGPLLYRYRPGRDGLQGTEGAFLPCSFWLVQALARSGRVIEADELFRGLLALASPLGLYAEEMDPVTQEHLGNFPQALTHAALVQAAIALRTAQVKDRISPDGSDRAGGPATKPADSSTLVLDRTARSVRQARRAVADACRGLSGDVIETARLLVSELATNALLHGAGSIRIAFERSATCLRVTVSDDAPALPLSRRADTDAVDGRGLVLVESLAARWGVTRHGQRKDVWFELQTA